MKHQYFTEDGINFRWQWQKLVFALGCWAVIPFLAAYMWVAHPRKCLTLLRKEFEK